MGSRPLHNNSQKDSSESTAPGKRQAAPTTAMSRPWFAFIALSSLRVSSSSTYSFFNKASELRFPMTAMSFSENKRESAHQISRNQRLEILVLHRTHPGMLCRCNRHILFALLHPLMQRVGEFAQVRAIPQLRGRHIETEPVRHRGAKFQCLRRIQTVIGK